MDIKPGVRLRSAVCEAEAIVVKWGAGATGELRCGGEPMVAMDAERPAGLAAAPGLDQGTLLGKRYTDEAGEIEVLCTKAGTSSLSLDDTPLQLKDAKPLPSSD